MIGIEELRQWIRYKTYECEKCGRRATIVHAEYPLINGATETSKSGAILTRAQKQDSTAKLARETNPMTNGTDTN